ncbi:DNA repair exonuclease [Candidatus Methanoliparum sp. LAM-1]|uniref:DNA repair exonuclease n=1 Tax=Candidatus Methanoliparum sp. LAM-1 TaxID=2874846 RepID=UPI001E64D824|nr:DNA repair exonuclease [Candidatus Methanoliparum sp. LAM-1]BDC36021.1 double-stranded DNA repair protein Mre11 [Candidatus Methanoliparum sp. LAM-1]
MRIAHISDTHLGYRQYNLYEREDDFYNSLNQAIDKAIEERVDVILHSGDLFHSPTPPIKALFSLKSVLDKIKGKIKIFTILGDHDKPKRRAMIPHNVFDIPVLGAFGKLEKVVVDGVLISGISNMKGAATEVLKEEIKRFDTISKGYKKSIFMAHQGIKKFLPFNYELTEDDLPRTARYYALGHIHSRSLERFGNGWLAYSGSTDICSTSEISPWRENGKGIYIIDLTDDDTEIYPVDLDIRAQYEIDTDNRLERVKEVLKEIPIYNNKKPLLHINIIDELANKREIEKSLNELLKDKIFWYRCIYRSAKERDKSIEIKKSFDMKKIFDEYFKDNYLSGLAYDLYNELYLDNIDNAKDTARDYLAKRYGVKNEGFQNDNKID